MSELQTIDLGALSDYLETEISPTELGQVLDGHLHSVIELAAKAEKPITQEQASACYHIRRLRDLLRGTVDGR